MKEMFEDVKVGDKVWSIMHGWGEVVCITQDKKPIQVRMEEGIHTYSTEGVEYNEDINPRLFWDEVKIEAPEKPKPELCEACKRHSSIVELDHEIRAILEVPKEVCDLSDRLSEHVEWAWKQHCTCEA